MNWKLVSDVLKMLANGVLGLAAIASGLLFLSRIYDFLRVGFWPRIDSMVYADLFGFYDAIVNPQDWYGIAAVGRFIFSLPVEVITMALAGAVFFILTVVSIDLDN